MDVSIHLPLAGFVVLLLFIFVGSRKLWGLPLQSSTLLQGLLLQSLR